MGRDVALRHDRILKEFADGGARPVKVILLTEEFLELLCNLWGTDVVSVMNRDLGAFLTFDLHVFGLFSILWLNFALFS